MHEFDRHKLALDLEFRRQQAEARLVLERSVFERVEAGRALMGLRFLGDDPRTPRQKHFSVSGPLGRFRDGDYGLLTTREPECRGAKILSTGIPVIVVRIRADALTVRLRNPEHAALLTVGQEYVLDDEPPGWYPNYQRLSLALALAQHSREPGDRLRAFLEGRMGGVEEEAGTVNFPPDLQGERARDAFSMALTRSVAAVQGPPGTGKTYLLARVARALVEQEKSVVLCCFTHRALNSALQAMLDAGVPAHRLGKVTGGDEGDLPPGVEVLDRRRYWEAPRRGMVAAMTVHAAFEPYWKALNRGVGRRGGGPLPVREGLDDETFWSELDLYNRRLIGASRFPSPGQLADALLVDEAGQLTIPMALCALPAAPRVAFFGDHAQLPPISSSAVLADSHASVFHLAAERYPDAFVRLNATHRMNAELCAFPARAFYQNDLAPTPEAGDRRLTVEAPDPWSEALGATPAARFLALDHERCTQESPLEAVLIADLVLTLLKEDRRLDPHRGLAVLAAHRRQTNVIRDMLHRRMLQLGLGRTLSARVEQVRIDTVDRMQGQERDVILYSLTASEPDTLDQEFDFLFLPNRFNVAITRARRKLLVVGSRRFFHHVPSSLLHAPWQGEEGEVARLRLRRLNVLKQWYLAHRDDAIDMTAHARALLAALPATALPGEAGSPAL